MGFWANFGSRLTSSLLHRVFEYVTVGAAVIAILASLFDWFQLSDNTYRNIALALAAVLLLTQFSILRTRSDSNKIRDNVAFELRRVDGRMRGFGLEVPAHDIPATITQALNSSFRWSFSGGTGSWQRRSVLPHLASIKDRSVPYRAQVVDPRNLALCATYAEYRRRSARNTGTTAIELQIEVFAYIYAICSYSSRSRLEASVSLLQDYSSLRFDVGDDELFVTAASALEPCLRVPKQNWIYKYIIDQIEEGARVLPRLSLQAAIQSAVTHGASASPEAVLPLVRVVSGGTESGLVPKDFPAELWPEIAMKACLVEKVGK